MPKYVIERSVPSIGQSSQKELQAACQKSNDTISSMVNKVQWQHSYVTNDKIYCVYIAPHKEAILEHAEKSGFPANKIEEVKAIMDPSMAG